MPALSVSEAIGLCVKAGIDALALTGGTPPAAVPCVVRKLGVVPSGKTVPEVVVYVGEEGAAEPLDARRKLKKYSVYVVIVTGGGHKTGTDPTIRLWRKLVEEVVDDKAKTTFATLITGAKLNRSDSVESPPPFNQAALAADLNYSSQAFSVEVIQERVTT
jgi:hypothetical protein